MRGRAGLPFVLVLFLCVGACAGLLGIKSTSSERPFEHRAHAIKGVNCLACHEGVGQDRDTALHLPAVATCTSCHEQPHDTRACDGCHGQMSTRQAAEAARKHLRFDHRTHLARTTDCVRCHEAAGDEHVGFMRPTMATCFSCHEHQEEWNVRTCDGCHVDVASEDEPPQSHLVHAGDFVREHGVRAASEGDLCASCHSERSCAKCHAGGTAPVLPARLWFDQVGLTGLHRAGFLARHATEARIDPGLCTTCHSETSCQGCHESKGISGLTLRASPHPPNWATGAPGGGGHGREARMDPASCASCHGGAGEQLCVGCHRVGGPGGNPHGPGFASSKDKTRDVPCRACHAGGT